MRNKQQHKVSNKFKLLKKYKTRIKSFFILKNPSGFAIEVK